MAGPADDDLNRRDFLRLGTAAVAAGAAGLGGDAALASQGGAGFYTAPPIDLVRIGMVGVGLQGGSHVENFLKIPHCRITAVCDIRAERTDWASKAITAAGHPAPTAYTGVRVTSSASARLKISISSSRPRRGNGTSR